MYLVIQGWWCLDEVNLVGIKLKPWAQMTENSSHNILTGVAVE